jgi:hypothetical protein
MEGEDEKKDIVWENIDCGESADHLVRWLLTMKLPASEPLTLGHVLLSAHEAVDSEARVELNVER